MSTISSIIFQLVDWTIFYDFLGYVTILNTWYASSLSPLTEVSLEACLGGHVMWNSIYFYETPWDTIPEEMRWIHKLLLPSPRPRPGAKPSVSFPWLEWWIILTLEVGFLFSEVNLPSPSSTTHLCFNFLRMAAFTVSEVRWYHWVCWHDKYLPCPRLITVSHLKWTRLWMLMHVAYCYRLVCIDKDYIQRLDRMRP